MQATEEGGEIGEPWGGHEEENLHLNSQLKNEAGKKH
jgi:hypothetical protein